MNRREKEVALFIALVLSVLIALAAIILNYGDEILEYYNRFTGSENG